MPLRIIAGELRGRRIAAPAGSDVRPTPDRVREALFSILGDRVPGSRFLDLFAGSGAVGFEARSRGAGAVVLVEGGRRAFAALERNLELLGLGREVVALEEPWPGALSRAHRLGAPFTIAFADPPYRDAPYFQILESLSSQGLMAGDGIIALEHETRTSGPDCGGGYVRYRTAAYGRVALSFYKLE